MMGTVRFPDQIAIGTLARLVRSPWNSARATDTDWCAVMELLDKNLRQVLAMSPSRLQRLSWAHNIASGCVLGAGTVPASSRSLTRVRSCRLAWLHIRAQPVIHGDIKLENMMVRTRLVAACASC